jgi:pSer/pThr/pTyr-binding forkhead associated (FHA) protein
MMNVVDDPFRTQLGAPPTVDPNRTMLGSAPTVNATMTIKPVQCPVCKEFNPPGVQFCIECGLVFDRALPEDAFGAPVVQLPVLVDAAGREYIVREGVNRLGRMGDVQIEDPRVSRQHAELRKDGQAFSVQDLGSTNGTFVEGVRLQPGEVRELAPGQSLSLGGFEVKLCLPGDGSKTQMALAGKTAALASPPSDRRAIYRLVGEGLDRPLGEGTHIIGRQPINDIPIADPYVSGKHAQLEISPEGVAITDLGSSNGTFVNDARLPANVRTALSENDTIRIGSKEYRIARSDGPSAGDETSG